MLVFSFLVAWAGNPALGQYQVYWGDVHGHTSHSDGKGTLDDFFIYARDVSNLDFAIVTDHDFGNGTPTWRMPQATWTLTQDKADQYTVNDGFVAFAGYEWTSQPKYWTEVDFAYVDRTFKGDSYYYLRVTQIDKDKLGNPSRAWSSPIWVKRRIGPADE